MAQKCIDLAESVLANSCLDFKPDSGGPDYWECSMCYTSTKVIYDPPGKMQTVSMNDLEHDDDCPYILANRLLDIKV